MLTVGSLFAGIGGFDLAAERAGLEVKWQVEIDDYATRVLEKHWPGATRYRDIRAVDWSTVEPVDIICGGFPCQPHSLAGKRLATADDRDLWPEVVRCLRGVRPGWFLGENVSGLLSSESGRFFGRVLGDLAACGFDAEWDCIPASAVGAPHRRDRVWIVAYSNHTGSLLGSCHSEQAEGVGEPYRHDAPGLCASVADTVRQRSAPRVSGSQPREEGDAAVAFHGGCAVADTDDPELEWRQERAWRRERRTGSVAPGHFFGGGVQSDEWWAVEPDVGRVAHGVPARVDRLRGLGNAIVPQVAEWIFSRIIEAEGRGVER